MSAYKIRLAAQFGGKDSLTGSGTAILLGIDARTLYALIGSTMDAHDLPVEYKQQGRRRTSEARAHTGSEHPVDVVYYWAMQQWGDRVRLDHDLDAAELWLYTDDAEVATHLTGKQCG